MVGSPIGSRLARLGAIAIAAVVLVSLFAILVHTAAEQPGEVTIVEMEPGNATIDENETIRIAATVENTGDAAVTDVVELSLADQERRVGVSLEPGQRRTIELDGVSADGLGLGTWRYDAVTGDDRETATLTVASDRPPQFMITDLEPGNLTIEDEVRINVSATVENTGGSTGEGTVALRLDNQTLVETDVSLGPTESDTVRIVNAGIAGFDGGTYEYGLVSANDSATAWIDLPEPAYLAIREFDPEELILDDGETGTVTVAVENRGERTANRTVDLLVDDEPVVSESVEVAGGDDRIVSLEIDADQLGVGTDSFVISTGDEAERVLLVLEGD